MTSRNRFSWVTSEGGSDPTVDETSTCMRFVDGWFNSRGSLRFRFLLVSCSGGATSTSLLLAGGDVDCIGGAVVSLSVESSTTIHPRPTFFTVPPSCHFSPCLIPSRVFFGFSPRCGLFAVGAWDGLLPLRRRSLPCEGDLDSLSLWRLR
jgi:hypothetical protein